MNDTEKLIERVKALEDALLFARLRLQWIAKYRATKNDELEEQGDKPYKFEDDDDWCEIEKSAKEGDKILLHRFLAERKL
jgi:hypothetical protein